MSTVTALYPSPSISVSYAQVILWTLQGHTESIMHMSGFKALLSCIIIQNDSLFGQLIDVKCFLPAKLGISIKLSDGYANMENFTSFSLFRFKFQLASTY